MPNAAIYSAFELIPGLWREHWNWDQEYCAHFKVCVCVCVCVCVGKAGEDVRDGESTITEGGWDSGKGVEMGECVGMLQDMCDKVVVVVVVIDVHYLGGMREPVTNQTTIGDESVGGWVHGCKRAWMSARVYGLLVCSHGLSARVCA